MFTKHIFSLFLLATTLGAGYALVVVYGVITVSPFQLLTIGILLGFGIGILGPALYFRLQKIHIGTGKSGTENTTLYVGNLPFRTTRYELRELFQPYGKIHSARIVIDRATRKPRGYGFVEMDGKGAEKAINSLNGHSLAGRNLKVSAANDRA